MTREEYLSTGRFTVHPRGNDLPHARLNPDLVREIRANREGMTAKKRAEKLGVHYRTVEKVLSGESWGHVK
jgi:hypothetical protein